MFAREARRACSPTRRTSRSASTCCAATATTVPAHRLARRRGTAALRAVSAQLSSLVCLPARAVRRGARRAPAAPCAPPVCARRGRARQTRQPRAQLLLTSTSSSSTGRRRATTAARRRRPVGAQEFFARVAQLLLLVLQLATREGYVHKTDAAQAVGAVGTARDVARGLRALPRGVVRGVGERQALIRARRGVRPRARAASSRPSSASCSGAISSRRSSPRSRGSAPGWRTSWRENARFLNLKVGAAASSTSVRGPDAGPRARARASGAAPARDARLLGAAGAVGLLSAGDHAVLASAWSFLRGLENRLRIEGERTIERIARGSGPSGQRGAPDGLRRAGRDGGRSSARGAGSPSRAGAGRVRASRRTLRHLRERREDDVDKSTWIWLDGKFVPWDGRTSTS